jgi:hypothetical protein
MKHEGMRGWIQSIRRFRFRGASWQLVVGQLALGSSDEQCAASIDAGRATAFNVALSREAGSVCIWKGKGGWWKVEGGRWKVEGGRWKVEGGWWTLDGEIARENTGRLSRSYTTILATKTRAKHTTMQEQ